MFTIVQKKKKMCNNQKNVFPNKCKCGKLDQDTNFLTVYGNKIHAITPFTVQYNLCSLDYIFPYSNLK